MMHKKLKIDLNQPYVQLFVLFGTLALALITNTVFGDAHNALNFLPTLFGIIIVIEIAFFVTLEIKEGAQEYGWTHEALDTVIALVVAAVIWYGASFLLNTNSPVSAVVSCSMLPNLQRGDFVIIQGSAPRAYEINMTQSELDSLTSMDSSVSFNGRSVNITGSLFTYCLGNSMSEVCRALKETPASVAEHKGAFTYHYETCGVSFTSGSFVSMPCLKSVGFKGKDYLTNFSNDIVVYQPARNDLYSQIGDIVHRTMFEINVGNQSYYITRGDNNPILDMQVFDAGSGLVNHPIPYKQLRGKVIGRIPLVGYFKLFLSGYFQEDSQCRTQLDFSHVN